MTVLNRRTLLTTAALGLATTACGTGPTPRDLTIASGEPGGFYLEFGQLLAAEINAEDPALRATAQPTTGSQDNLARLATGRAHLALVLTDTAQATVAARTPLHAIGRVYENYLQLVVLASGPIHTVADLAGRTISLGAEGSGAELTGRRLLAATGLHTAVTVTHYPLADAVSELRAGRIDAVLWSGGVPTPALASLATQRGIRLLPLGEHLPALRAAYDSTYERVTVPADAYPPSPETTTIGVANLLVCRPDADPAIVATATRVLVTHAPRLVPQQALGTQFLDPRNLIATDDIPLHPAAASTYRTLHG
ncbi:TAXI family TRAP transporter solute-binding subunit [Pseudonocardia acaciae]|uniref:TAXI family TRAP transporter solute-binding subunit n=1 Tax=Pseudonocardia acaciae TaxID=551276 RepID=UPI00048D7D1B|nr:TAXI family TRAP transporter solute-binding subunit [Pseudonocardia acaciae]